MSGDAPLLGDLEAQMAACADMLTPELWQRFGTPQNCLIAIADYLSGEQKNLLDILDCRTGERSPKAHDVTDIQGHFHWFYHRHDAEDKKENQTGGGHFHLFATPKFFRDTLSAQYTHLIAIELDRDGDLGSFFVPNIWVTDEKPRPSEHLKSACQKFDARLGTPSHLVSIWLAALMRTFLGDILNLLEQRDRFLAAIPQAERKRYFADTEISRICEWKLS